MLRMKTDSDQDTPKAPRRRIVHAAGVRTIHAKSEFEGHTNNPERVTCTTCLVSMTPEKIVPVSWGSSSSETITHFATWDARNKDGWRWRIAQALHALADRITP